MVVCHAMRNAWECVRGDLGSYEENGFLLFIFPVKVQTLCYFWACRKTYTSPYLHASIIDVSANKE